MPHRAEGEFLVINSGHAHTILVIDDRDEVCSILTRLLTIEGHQVKSARNGQEGLALAREDNPDLVFVDLSLPDISGWEVVQTIKQANDQTKVVLMTGWAPQLTEAEVSEHGVDLLLSKPFNFNDVLNALNLLNISGSKLSVL